MVTGTDTEDADSSSTTRWLVGFCICLVAIGVFAMVAALFERTSIEPIRGGQTTSGRITKVNGVCDIDGCSYTATIEFHANGRTRTMQTSLDYQQPKPVLGSTVQLSYDPADSARVHDLSLQRHDWVSWEIVGAAFVLLGLPGALLSVRSLRR